jgi:hypothetical protein
MNTTTASRFRTVKAPRGTLVHFDYLNDGRTDDVVRSTSCGRKVPATWTVEAVEDGLAAVHAVTCPTCLQWAGWRRAKDDADAQLAARLGADWKDQPDNHLAATDLGSARQLLTRLQELDDLGETPVAAAAVQNVRPDMVQALAGYQPLPYYGRPIDTPTGHRWAGPAPSASTAVDAGRRAALRRNAAQARQRLTAAVRRLPPAGTVALC